MAVSDSTPLALTTRPVEGSRAARRLRREGLVPGVIYGTGAEPEAFSADARVLRNTLAHSGAVIEVSLDGAGGVPVLVKAVQRHPVRGDVWHLDLLRVRLDEVIQATATLELQGAEAAEGVKAGGVLTQELVTLAIEALPGDIPDVIRHDVSALELNGTVTVAELAPPAGVKLLDDPETVAVTITPPSAEPVEEELEVETELVGEPGAAAEAKASGDTGEAAEQKAGDDA
jgi:large subunit ribosomal protein L25